jgi:hypothetical protein
LGAHQGIFRRHGRIQESPQNFEIRNRPRKLGLDAASNRIGFCCYWRKVDRWRTVGSNNEPTPLPVAGCNCHRGATFPGSTARNQEFRSKMAHSPRSDPSRVSLKGTRIFFERVPSKSISSFEHRFSRGTRFRIWVPSLLLDILSGSQPWRWIAAACFAAISLGESRLASQ